MLNDTGAISGSVSCPSLSMQNGEAGDQTTEIHLRSERPALPPDPQSP